MGFGEELPDGLDILVFFPEGTPWTGDLDLEALGSLTRSGKFEADVVDVAEVAEARKQNKLAMTLLNSQFA